jgi:hypothetical protein
VVAIHIRRYERRDKSAHENTGSAQINNYVSVDATEQQQFDAQRWTASAACSEIAKRRVVRATS